MYQPHTVSILIAKVTQRYICTMYNFSGILLPFQLINEEFEKLL